MLSIQLGKSLHSAVLSDLKRYKIAASTTMLPDTFAQIRTMTWEKFKSEGLVLLNLEGRNHSKESKPLCHFLSSGWELL